MISFKDYYKQINEQNKEDHSIALNVAKHVGDKVKNFSHGKYKNGTKIPGLKSYTFHGEVTHASASKALEKMGFKSPSFTGMHKDHENMTSKQDSHISPTHMVHFTAGHGEPLRMHVQDRRVSESAELEEAEGLTTKKADVGHHVFYNGTKIGHVESRKVPWLRGKTVTKIIAKKADGTEVPVDSDSKGKNTVESAKQTLLKHHLKSESEELSEAVFVSDSPSTNASRGVKFDVVKNKEKSVGEHPSGHPKEHHDVFHEGKHIGHVASYSGYKDKKPAGSRIVTSRKDVRLWQATIHGGEHNRHGGVFNNTPAGSQYTETRFGSKKDALQHLADAHNSNKNR